MKGFRTLAGMESRCEVIQKIPFERLLLLVDEEPTCYNEAKGSQCWQKAMDDEIKSIEENKTWSLVQPPRDVQPIGLKWVYKTKRNAQGKVTRHKARLVAKGYVQKFGIDYHEVFAPVTRIETVRFLLALTAQKGWEVHHLDVKTAFLHGELKKDVYVKQPDGYARKGKEHYVYKLKKALYGLKQASRAWNTKLHHTLIKLGFKRYPMEHAVYKREDAKGVLLVGVYVDDLIVTGSRLQEIVAFKKQMQCEFEMSDLGMLNYYLGFEVEQSSKGISMRQTAYVTKVLKEAQMWEANATQYPMDPGLQLMKEDAGGLVDATTYRRLVGCLRYITHTRPDISYAIGVVSRFMDVPKIEHLKAVKQILRYLRGTVSYGLHYKRNSKMKLVGYCDSSHASDRSDGKSTSGMVFYYGGGPIAWSSQKQRTVALSSCEAEFMAATSAACQAIWLRGLLEDITGVKMEATTLLVDNKSAIELMKNPVFHGRSKHINTRYHFIRECVEDGLVKVEFVRGEDQKADILTKALPRIRFAEMRKYLGMVDLLKQN